MPTVPKECGKTALSRQTDENENDCDAPGLVSRSHELERLARPLPQRRRSRLPARDLFLYLPALVEADTGVPGLFFHDSFEQYRAAVQSGLDAASVKAQALALLSHREQIEGRLLSALSDVLEWHRRMQELMDHGELTAADIGSED